MTKYSKSETEEAIATLRELLHPGDTVFLNLKHVSKSGMMRVIQPMIMRVDSFKVAEQASKLTLGTRMINLDDGILERRYIGFLAAKALGEPSDGDQGVKMGGAGMDMGFALVYALAYKLFSDGYACLGANCPANDHVNARWHHCAVCGKSLEREHFTDVIDMTTEENQQIYRWKAGNLDGRDWYSEHPLFTRKNRGWDAGVCSAECVTREWHHRESGYALNYKWL